MTVNLNKKIIIIAGPNGAGKTTFAKNFLPQEARKPTRLRGAKVAANSIICPGIDDRCATVRS